MNERLNKPRIFLSHSKKDADLIRRLYDDLRQCQIDPWIDEMDIRPGKPWLDAIFEEGIPTCDCVFVYLTEHSVSSAMVKKELDAAVLGQLEDNKIALLPYVSTATVRAGLRADIRGLQIPVLDRESYSQVLPKLVAEVWRSFLERTIEAAVQRERVKRLEAELELERISKASNDSVFNEAEEREFAYIAKQLNREELVKFTETKNIDAQKRQKLRVISFEVSVLSLLPDITSSECYEYVDDNIYKTIRNLLLSKIPDVNKCDTIFYPLTISEGLSLTDEMLRYGFTQRTMNSNGSKNIKGFIFGNVHSFVYTDRLERFKYWLAFKGMMPEKLVWSLVGVEEIRDQDNAATE